MGIFDWNMLIMTMTMGVAPAGWFIRGKKQHLEMDDDYRGTPMTQETAKGWKTGVGMDH